MTTRPEAGSRLAALEAVAEAAHRICAPGTKIGEVLPAHDALKDALAAYYAAAKDDGWQPMTETPETPIAVEYYHGNWPTGSERFNRLKRSLGHWDGKTWREHGTGHEVFEFLDMVDNHPTHWRPLPPPPHSDTGEGR